ncbi:MAG: hypothetical protein AAB599_02590 [Patescibacteria group bacterium]
MSGWKHWRYKNLTFLSVSIILAIYFKKIGLFEQVILFLGPLGYFGAFFAGFMFVLTFTVSFAIALLFELGQKLTVWELGLIAGIGGVFGDLVIFKFVKNRLVEEVKPIYEEFGGRHLTHLLHSKYFSWTLPVIGTLIMVSPFPDELGVTLLGISKIKTWKFVLISFVLNVAAVFLVLLWAAAVR